MVAKKTKGQKEKDSITIPELAEQIKGHVKVPNGLDIKKLDEFLTNLRSVCYQKKGSPEIEIAKKEKEVGKLTPEQIEFIEQKYVSIVKVKDCHANALNLFGYSVENIRNAVKIITAKD